mmetsp:Transcript_17108/g.27310  ORF Transcript_17108/g.27310 Transcript_17108/m.27310 type:complete len:123 (+) Transcript_17108:130-498(+)
MTFTFTLSTIQLIVLLVALFQSYPAATQSVCHGPECSVDDDDSRRISESSEQMRHDELQLGQEAEETGGYASADARQDLRLVFSFVLGIGCMHLLEVVQGNRGLSGSPSGSRRKFELYPYVL